MSANQFAARPGLNDAAKAGPDGAATRQAPSGSIELSAQIDQASRAMVATMRNQRWQDFLFHKITLAFALSVLLVLVGIIISLLIGSWPAFRQY